MKEQQENSNSLPNGWSWATIGDLIDASTGLFKDGDWIESKDQNPDGNVRLIQLADVGDLVFKNRSNKFMNKETAIALNCTFLQQGDILVARMPDPIGRACLFPFAEDDGFVTVVDVAVIRVGQNSINNKLLMYFMNSPAIRKKIELLQTGTTRKRISRGNLATIEFPIPPINEQDRIVEKIEELFSELDNAITKLTAILQDLKIYQEALLASEFEKVSGAPVHILKDLCSIISGVTKGRNLSEKKVIDLPYLRVANVQDGYLDLKEIKTITVLESELKKYKLVYGDILYTEGGDRDKLGRCVVWRDEVENCIHQNHVFRARPKSSDSDSHYISYYSKTRIVKNYFYKHGKQTTNLASINISVLSNLPVPLPGIDEQKKIVENLDLHFSIYENTKMTVEIALAEISYFKRIILKKAYDGALVEQFASDDPAEDLLMRIKKENAEQKNDTKRRTAPKINRQNMSNQHKGIIDILNQSKNPVSAKELWDKSQYKGDIERFYAELKKVQHLVVETKKGFLSIKKEKEKA